MFPLRSKFVKFSWAKPQSLFSNCKRQIFVIFKDLLSQIQDWATGPFLGINLILKITSTNLWNALVFFLAKTFRVCIKYLSILEQKKTVSFLEIAQKHEKKFWSFFFKRSLEFTVDVHSFKNKRSLDIFLTTNGQAYVMFWANFLQIWTSLDRYFGKIRISQTISAILHLSKS